MSLNNYFGHYGSQADHPLAFFYDCQHSAESEYKSGSSIENTEALGTLIFDTSANATKEKKRRLTTSQIEFLERSFQEEIKLEPERKVRLSQELGIQPRQVAVWFQNRRARWKAKQLERVYNALKQEFDAISKEKQILQEEVTKLKAELEEKVRKESSGQTDVSGEETVESSVVRGTDSEKMRGSRRYNHIGGECHELFESNPTSPPYWCG